MITSLNWMKNIIKLIILIIRIKLKKTHSLEKKIKIYIEDLGPVFIKFAQMISIRTDIIPENIIKELEKLQTHAKHIHFLEIKNKIKEIDEVLYNNINKINENPLASASIAQIHTAILNNKKKIIIKILKPEVKNIIKRDINILYKLSKISIFFFKKLERLKIIDVIDEIKNTFENEINFKKESLNIIKIKKNIKGMKDIYIPNIIETKKEDILIIEYLDGINITNKKKFKKIDINSTNLIKTLLKLFYKQVFEDDIFHADLHPGNILISKTKLKQTIIILLDFGIISGLHYDEKIYLGENILAFAKKDYKKIIHLHLKAHTIEKNDTINIMEKELYDTFKSISGKKLEDIEIKSTINSLMKLSKKFNMQIQPNLILFQKTLLTIEGICRNLDVKINLWQLTRHVMEKILIREVFKIKNITENKKTINIMQYKRNISILSNNFLIFLIMYICSLIILNIIIKYYITNI
ncbi:MAG TPA: ABC1 kinase family protein [Candidatus Azoamicus sp. MARI]